MCLGVVGSAALAGTVVLVLKRRAARRLRNKPQYVDRSQNASRVNSARGSPVPPRPLSPLKVLQANSPAGSPVPAVARSATSSPVLGSAISPPVLSPVGAGSPQLLPIQQHRLGLRTPSSPGSASFPRPLSPLRIGAAPAAAADSLQQEGRPPVGMKHSSSFADMQDTGSPLGSPLAAHSLPASPHCQLAMARSVSFSEAAAAGRQLSGLTTSSQEADDFTEVQPGCPRTTSFDGLPCADHISSRPASPAGLKLHVAAALRSSATDGAKSRVHAEAADSQEVGYGQQVDGDTPVASPRDEAMLGVLAAAAAAAAMNLPEQFDADDES